MNKCKIYQSSFEYVGNPLYKSDNAFEGGVWRIYLHGFVSGLTTLMTIYPPNTSLSGIITYVTMLKMYTRYNYGIMLSNCYFVSH